AALREIQRGAFGLNRATARSIVERSDGGTNREVALPDLHGDGALRWSGDEHRRIEPHRRDVVAEREAMLAIRPREPGEAGRGENDGVESSLGKGANARWHIAAQKTKHQIGTRVEQQRAAPGRRRSDTRAVRKRQGP